LESVSAHGVLRCCRRGVDVERARRGDPRRARAGASGPDDAGHDAALRGEPPPGGRVLPGRLAGRGGEGRGRVFGSNPAPRQRNVVQQLPGRRRRLRVRVRPGRPRVRRGQAHEPVRRRGAGRPVRGLQARGARRPHLRVWRHRRVQPDGGRGAGCGDSGVSVADRR
jgi:hypothetical protein